MVPKSQLKIIASLQQKKYRTRYGLFVAEGIKVIKEFLDSSFALDSLYTTQADIFPEVAIGLHEITEAELKKMSFLKTPNRALAVFKIPTGIELVKSGLILALDDIRDPGNLGTIIRLCDWFGIKHLVCSTNTVDCFNPKTVQATMGSLTRVQVHYTGLAKFLDEAGLKSYAAVMEGKNVHEEQLPKEGVLILGNEANGISEEIQKLADYRLTIPRFGKLQQTESLNVATAAAILLNEFKRNS